MKFLNNIDVQPNKDDFYKIRQLPGVIGCVDGTRVWIITPRDHEANFVNRKGYDSLNVQVICDANVKWTNLVARWRGSAHDSRIIRSSITWDITENGHTGGYITGDSGYPYLPYYMLRFNIPSLVFSSVCTTVF